MNGLGNSLFMKICAKEKMSSSHQIYNARRNGCNKVIEISQCLSYFTKYLIKVVIFMKSILHNVINFSIYSDDISIGGNNSLGMSLFSILYGVITNGTKNWLHLNQGIIGIFFHFLLL